MTARRALVVDDSRSARAFLTRILERYELAVDGVESAEQAIEYLIHQRPDVIFMDHLMPGMDGFQAVQAIKNNPRTATIPIMMYTSQEGELYLSQARALGAIGVLPKQTKHTDVSKALEQLKLLADAPLEDENLDVPTVEMRSGAANGADGAAQRTGTYASLKAGTGATGSHAQIEDTAKLQAPPARVVPPVERRSSSRPNAPAMPAEVRAVVEAMVAHHMRELQRFVAESLENQADRVVTDVRHMMQDQESATTASPTGTSGAAGAAAAARTPSGVLIGLAGVIVACLVGWQWQQQRADSAALAAQLALAQQQLSASHQDLQSLQQADAATAAAIPNASPSRPPEMAIEPVPFAEMPLSGARQERIQTLLNHLNAQGFHGVVEIRSIPGRFCMVNGSGATPVLAADTLPYGKCDQVGNPREDNGSASERQSVAFANMIATARQNSNGKLDIQLGAGTADETITSYPPVTDTLTAGEWNKAGAANNRIEVRWQATR